MPNWDEYVRNHAETAYHPSCTCAMGEGSDAVVDGQGRVHGITALRVVDASIMPDIITGNRTPPPLCWPKKSPTKSAAARPCRAPMPIIMWPMAHRYTAKRKRV